MNRLATLTRVVGIVTVSVFVVLVTRTPSTRDVLPIETAMIMPATAEPSYLPAQYADEERAAQASELPAQF